MSHNETRRGRMRRRVLLTLLGGAALPFTQTREASAAIPESLRALVKETTRGALLQDGRMKLELPQIAENGSTVALKVTVETPMTAADHVRSITLLSEKNPRPVIGRFYLGAKSGRAEINTRIRLAGTQRVVAIAEMSDGAFRSASAPVAVSMAACIDGSE
jgi:sulfur-oxidizing protein SoxY